MKVVILDGNQRSALAATRSLGAKGIEVAVGEEFIPCLSSRSRFCRESFVYPSPGEHPHGFIKAINDCAGRCGGAVLFPMTDVSLSEVLKRRNDLREDIHLPFADYQRYMALSDKARLFRTANALGIPMPPTVSSLDWPPGDIQAAMREASALRFPLVVKSSRSRMYMDGSLVIGSVDYVRDRVELERVLSKEAYRKGTFVIQERIEGPGVGIFLLSQEGRIHAHFAHRRIREKPPSGGVSVLCESISPSPLALDSAAKLLEHTGWSGVAMVEFKLDRRDHDIPKLIEVNARFWGSLQLAVSSGVDFPYLLYRMAAGLDVAAPGSYATGLRSRWELGDLDHVLICLKKGCRDLPPAALTGSRIDALMNFLATFFDPRVRNEVARYEDPQPFLFEFKQYLRDLLT